MAEVKWSARRISDGVLVDVTGDTESTPQAAPTPNALEGGGGAIAVTDGTTTVQDVTALSVPAASDEGGGVARILPDSWSVSASGGLQVVGTDPLRVEISVAGAIDSGAEGLNIIEVKPESAVGAGAAAFAVDASGFVVVRLMAGAAFRVARSSPSTTIFRIDEDAKIGFFGVTPVARAAANPDTSGATLAALETEVNELKALLRAYGLLT